MKEIKLEGVSKVYGRSYALHRATTTFRGGTLVALLGPNGAGKSTMLSIIATLLQPDKGRVLYDRVPHESVLRRGRGRFGYVSHDALLYLDLSGRENLTFYASLYGIPNPNERIDELTEKVSMTWAADKIVRGYSRGMRQRLSIARALLQRPEVLLLDEPFTGLDQWGEDDLRGILDEERKNGGIILLSTHRLGMPAGYCDEIRILKRGRILLDRTLEPDENLAEVYAGAFVTPEPSPAKDVSEKKGASDAEEAMAS